MTRKRGRENGNFRFASGRKSINMRIRMDGGAKYTWWRQIKQTTLVHVWLQANEWTQMYPGWSKRQPPQALFTVSSTGIYSLIKWTPHLPLRMFTNEVRHLISASNCRIVVQVPSPPGQTPRWMTSVVTGRARLLGFRVGFVGQNPSLGTLRLSGFGPFRALGFSGLFQAFLVYVQQ